MSQSITVQGTFKNGKTRTVGLHNPMNNRIFNDGEKSHVWKMVNKYLVPIKHKFVGIKFTVHFQSGKTLSANSLGEALGMLRQDIVNV